MNKLDTIKRKIKYRSEYRGIKEMDLLLGSFVKNYILIIHHVQVACVIYFLFFLAKKLFRVFFLFFSIFLTKDGKPTFQ